MIFAQTLKTFRYTSKSCQNIYNKSVLLYAVSTLFVMS